MSEQTQLNFGGGNTTNQPVTVLGKTFANDDERRKYFREELRKKLPELKQIEGYPIGEDDDIIELSDPPYYTACPNPWLNDFVAQWEEEKIALEKAGKRKHNFEVKEPYASDVSEGKKNTIYNAFSYHTKVPHLAIMRYLLHYTQVGDIILDGFSGTGMTGVAAQMCGASDEDLKRNIEYEFKTLGYKQPIWGKRKAILGDLSPIASFIDYNYNTPIDINHFNKEAEKLFNVIEEECSWLYETLHTDGSKARINYVVWSDVFICPNCGSEIVFFNQAVDKETGQVLSDFSCPNCESVFNKKNIKREIISVFDECLGHVIKQGKNIPVLIEYTAKDGKKYQKIPTVFDLELIKKIENYKIPFWYPSELMMNKGSSWGDTWRSGYHYGITNVHHFYTKRNLIVLSSIYNNIAKFQPCWLAAFTGVITALSKQQRYRMFSGFPNMVLSGTLYIGSLIREWEAISWFKGKISSLAKMFKINYRDNNFFSITTQSTTVLQLKDNTIDYIFTDPPFGENIMYSELNFIQESWLKVKTNNKEEVIENNSQNKGLLEYQNLMQKCLAEYYRVLKPSKWITIEFSNTSASVWNSIQLALNRVGFVIANVSALDKKQGSFKAVTTPTAVKQDLVISCYKPSESFTKNFLKEDTNANIWSFVEEYLEHLPLPAINEKNTTAVIERSPKVLHDRLITYFLMRNLPVPIDAADFQEGLRKKYKIEDGMVFNEEQYLAYLKLKKEHKTPIQLKLIVDIIENESDAIQWIRERIKDKPMKYQDIQPDYRKAYAVNRKGEIEIELRDILEENFIENDDHTWRIPNLEEQKDREILRTKALLKTWNEYVSAIERNGKKLKDVRLEALRAGFKDCIDKKDYQTIVRVGDKIPENILTEDEILLNFYDIASNKI